MIRVELLGQRRSPWAKALLSALVVCGGLYGIHRLFPALAGSLFSADSAFTPAAQQETTVPAKPVERREIAPKPGVQQSSQETAPKPAAQQAATPTPAVQRETAPKPDVQQEATPSPVQETAPKPAAQQEVPLSSAAQQETTPTPAVQREAAPRPTTPAPTSPQRSTACHQVMRIDEQVPAGIRVASLNCNSTGEYWLEGTSPSHTVLRTFRLRLQALPSQVSFSVWREGRALRFAFQGRFAEQDALPLAALSSDQAEQFFGKVAGWAGASGLDSLSIHAPIHTRTHQRQKLRGLGSPQQISAFLHQLQQAEAVATLGEVLLMPVQSDERGWVKARLYAAVDILVQAP